MKDFYDTGQQLLATDRIVKKSLLGFIVVVGLTLSSHRFLDAPAASFFDEFIRAHALTPVVSNIPDLLFYIVAAVTAGSWVGYWYRVRHGFDDNHARFLKLWGTVAPLAFVSKMVFQYLFGRSTPELWIVHHHAPQFHWFRADQGYGCFPSGHMTVFTALVAALWHHYPRYHPLYLVFLTALAIALIATNYHFVSDVAAGAYLGAMICVLASRLASGAPTRRS